MAVDGGKPPAVAQGGPGQSLGVGGDTLPTASTGGFSEHEKATTPAGVQGGSGAPARAESGNAPVGVTVGATLPEVRGSGNALHELAELAVARRTEPYNSPPKEENLKSPAEEIASLKRKASEAGLPVDTSAEALVSPSDNADSSPSDNANISQTDNADHLTPGTADPSPSNNSSTANTPTQPTSGKRKLKVLKAVVDRVRQRCKHNRKPYYCVDCKDLGLGGQGICEHRVRRDACKVCKAAGLISSMNNPCESPWKCRLDLLKGFRDAARPFSPEDPDCLLNLVRLAVVDGTLRYKEDEVPNIPYRFMDWLRGDERYRPVIEFLKALGFKRPFWQPGCLSPSNASDSITKVGKAFSPELFGLNRDIPHFYGGWARVIWRLCERAVEDRAQVCRYKALSEGRLLAVEGLDDSAFQVLSASMQANARVEASRTCEICGRRGNLRHIGTVECEYCHEWDALEPEWDVESECWGWEVKSEGFYVDAYGELMEKSL
ncbi:hypothetical protein HK101_000724 [Irineochytrium annulatum]|nr:hypothetical protein HK101_000724 [Irineochytrium annulatum]